MSGVLFDRTPRGRDGREWVVCLARCVECPDCGFRFDADHTESDTPAATPTYSCPLCVRAPATHARRALDDSTGRR